MAQEQQTSGQRALELIRLLLPNLQPTTQDVLRSIRLALAVGLVILGVLLILDIIGLLFGITLWNLLKVLATPITVGAAVPLLNWLQKKRELDVENQRAQDEALQAYLDQMGALILQDYWGQSEEVHKARQARILARARTLTVLSRLDGNRKASIVQFLSGSDLIVKDHVLVNLSKADLRGADFRGANLRGASFSSTSHKRNTGANLSGADLGDANLRGVDFRGANLRGVNFRGANLRNADFRQADLDDDAPSGAYLRDTIMPNGERAAPSPLLPKSPTIEIEERLDGEDGDDSGPS
jgi:uncharacterized protein YjbI with pentapeptide repeats